VNRDLLPEGHHYGLHIEHGSLIRPGGFAGGGWKLIWHTTESPSGHGTSGVVSVLQAKGAEVHVVIDPATGKTTQLIPFDNFGKGLMHPAGTPETNRARCIQVEICGYARSSPDWPESYYKHLASLATLIEHRIPIPRRVGRSFSATPNRLTPQGFVRAAGHFGHEHVPNNDHWDPGAMRARHLLNLMEAH
jgi:hypothetical protein